ncbi:MAG: hypothetical protein ABJO09_01280 [Hyphomicrobiales bacterium]
MADPYFQFTKLLERSQWYEPAKLKALQDKGLTRMLVHAWQQAPAYRERLAPLFEKGEVPDLSRWQEIPILTRKEAQANSLEYYARHIPEQAGETFEQQTSGSTGMPFKHRTSALQKVANQATIARNYSWFGVDANKSCAILAASQSDDSSFPNGFRGPQWQRGFPNGMGYWLDHKSTNSAQKLDWLRRNPTHYLGTTPNMALGIMLEARKLNVELKPYDALLIGSEVLTDSTAEVLRSELSNTIINLYGSEECGRMAGWCSELNNLHINEEVCLVELLDEQDCAVEPGQTGRIVVTPFYNFAMPLIRYDIGDYATLTAEPCKCRRSSRAFSSIAGRERNLFKFIDGSSTWPSIRVEEFQAIVPFQQWQITQRKLDHLEVSLVLADRGIPINYEAFQKALCHSLNAQFSVSINEVTEIPRETSGKYEEFRSLI